MIDDRCCPEHNFNLVSMPRSEDEEDDDYGYAFKCPIKACSFGVFRPIIGLE